MSHLEQGRLLGRAELAAHVHHDGPHVTVGAVHGGEHHRLVAASVLLDVCARLDEEVAAHFERLVASHEHANLTGILVLQELQGPDAALFPLALDEAVGLGLGLEQDVLVLLAGSHLDVLELDERGELRLALSLDVGGVVGVIALGSGRLGGGGEGGGVEGGGSTAEPSRGTEAEDGGGGGGSLLLLLLSLRFPEPRNESRKKAKGGERARKGERGRRVVSRGFREKKRSWGGN